jgi:hypothetical protein
MRDVGGDPYLVTVSAEGTAHVVSVQARLTGDRVVVGAGQTSRANVTSSGRATLLWPAPPGGDYSLIVDGVAKTSADEVAVEPTRAVLHRVANASDELPGCIAIEQPSRLRR